MSGGERHAGAPTIVAIVLAAGSSRRLGREKQLVPYHGKPLVRIAAEAACGVPCARVAVVVGESVHPIEVALSGLAVDLVPNPDAHEGMASSIRHGVAWAVALRADAVLILVCDQPDLTASHLASLCAVYQGGTPRPSMVASRYSDVLGVPALFDHSHFDALASLQGDEGAKSLLRGALPDASPAFVDFPEGAFDVDTRADAARLRAPR